MKIQKNAHFILVWYKNINVESSPQEIQNKLKSIGLKPINSIVDITNYVMHEIGQPLHAFDLDKIENITVKSLKSGTKFKTLDESEIKLNNEDLMICSNSEPFVLQEFMVELILVLVSLLIAYFLNQQFLTLLQ